MGWFLGSILTGRCGSLIINEIHYNPDQKLEQVEFVEIFNRSTSAVDLSQWQIGGGIEFRFPAGTRVAGNGFVVVAQSPSHFRTKFGGTALGPYQGRLSAESDRIELRNGAGGVEDVVEYQLGFPWPTVGAPPGYSIELLHPEADNDLGGNWRASAVDAAG